MSRFCPLTPPTLTHTLTRTGLSTWHLSSEYLNGYTSSRSRRLCKQSPFPAGTPLTTPMPGFHLCARSAWQSRGQSAQQMFTDLKKGDICNCGKHTIVNRSEFHECYANWWMSLLVNYSIERPGVSVLCSSPLSLRSSCVTPAIAPFHRWRN